MGGRGAERGRSTGASGAGAGDSAEGAIDPKSKAGCSTVRWALVAAGAAVARGAAGGASPEPGATPGEAGAAAEATRGAETRGLGAEGLATVGLEISGPPETGLNLVGALGELAVGALPATISLKAGASAWKTA